MAGSLNSIIGDDGHFTMEDINNLEDAEQALHQRYNSSTSAISLSSLPALLAPT